MTPPIPKIPAHRPAPPTSERSLPVQPASRQPASLETVEQAIRVREAAIDAALEMTVPASDPPAWTS